MPKEKDQAGKCREKCELGNYDQPGSGRRMQRGVMIRMIGPVVG